MKLGAQHTFAGFIAELPDSRIAKQAVDLARQSLLDTVSVTYAGANESVNRSARAYGDLTEDSMRGATEWLTGRRRTLEHAALLNGVAAHAIDYDDVTPAWRGHPGAVLWPALWSFTGPDHSFRDLLAAFAVGCEVGARIGLEISETHYAAGWHATSTMGCISATAACARLLRMDAATAFNALGLAVAQASGVQANFGTGAKPLQAGFAAAAAVRSVLLAQSGVEAGDALEGRNGFSMLYGSVGTLNLRPQDLGSRWRFAQANIEVKQFPNCYAAHRAVEAALGMHREQRLDVKGVRSVEITGTPGAHKPLIEHLPRNADEARFSAAFGVACALLDGNVRLGSFSEGQLGRADLVSLMTRTRVFETSDLGAVRAACVRVEMSGGERIERTVRELPGRFGEAGFMARLREKTEDCVSAFGCADHGPRVWREILALEDAEPALRLERVLPFAAPPRAPAPKITSAVQS